MKLEEKIQKAKEHFAFVALREGRDWISPTEIGRIINGGHSSVGTPVCKRMVEDGLLVRNDKGHYKLR